MSVGLIFLMSVVCVGAALVVLLRTLGLRRVVKNATWIDVGFTLVACLTLAGTLTGLLIGILSGLVMTGCLTVMRSLSNGFDGLRAASAKPAAPQHPDDDGYEPAEGWTGWTHRMDKGA